MQKLFALARVFGNIPDDLFSRDYEQMIFRTVARAGMGPKLLVRSLLHHRIDGKCSCAAVHGCCPCGTASVCLCATAGRSKVPKQVFWPHARGCWQMKVLRDTTLLYTS